MRKYHRVLILVSVILVSLLIRLPGLEEPLDNDSGANAYHAWLMLKGEPLYSSHHPGHHLPGIYFTYWLAFSLGGDREASIKSLGILVTCLTSILIYWIALRSGKKESAWLAILFYVLLSQHDWLKGNTLLAELFANLPITGAIFIGVSYFQQDRRKWKLFLSGLLSGIAILYKIQFLAPLIINTLLLVIAFFFEDQDQQVRRNLLWSGAWMGFGFLIPGLIVTVHLLSLGLGAELLQAFILGGAYIRDPEISLPAYLVPLMPLFMLAFINLALLVLGFGSSLRLLKGIRAKFAKQKQEFYLDLAMVTWFILSLLEAGATAYAYTHYTVIVAPPLAVLAAREIFALVQNQWIRVVRTQLVRTAALMILLGLVTVASLPVNGNFYWHYIRYKLGIETYDEFLGRGLIDGNSLITVMRVAEFIRGNTQPEDFIYYWSDNVQLYYLVKRRSPLENIWPLYFEAFQNRDAVFDPRTKYIILGTSQQKKTKPEWFLQGLETHYMYDRNIAGEEVYVRRDVRESIAR